MRKVVLVASMLCLALMGVGPVALAQGAGQGLNGVWLGYYAYSDGRPDRVQFQLKASRAGAAFTATTIEPNTFGSKDALFLTADVAGKVSADGGVRFTSALILDSLAVAPSHFRRAPPGVPHQVGLTRAALQAHMRPGVAQHVRVQLECRHRPVPPVHRRQLGFLSGAD